MVHDQDLLDRLSAIAPEAFEGRVFRATRIGLDPLTPSSAGGRWAPHDGPPVLYTSVDRSGALAEISFHLAQLTPLPKKPVAIHELAIVTRKTLRLLRTSLTELGVDWRHFGEPHYSRTQQIGAAVAFLECDGLIAPSARWECDNLMLFLGNHKFEDKLEVIASDQLDWQVWAHAQGLL